MKPATLALLALALAACARTSPPAPAGRADLVLTNGDLRTMNPAQPAATALAVKDGRIVYVGDEAGLASWRDAATRVIDARGRTVLPGLIDSHIHAAESALTQDGCTLNDDELTIEAAAPRIRACLDKDRESPWLLVNGVNPAGFKATRQQLDAIERERPMFLWGSDGHTGWANTKALALAQVTRATQNPAAGRIERDARGDATGFLVDEATHLVLDIMPKPTAEQRIAKLRGVLPQLRATGITAYLEANTDAPTVAAYAELARRNELDAHVTIAFESSGDDTPGEFARLEALRAQLAHQPLIRADFIKLFADGVMEFPTQTAAMLAPYLDARGKPTKSTGKYYLEPAAMASFIQHADARGFNVHVHAIGDGGVRETLEAFAAARAAGSKRLYSIAHLQLIDPADLPRFAQLDVLASFQLLWAQPDNYSIDAVEKYLGPERFARQYPTRSLVKAGGVIAGGSDWDVSSFNPFEAIATAMSRRNGEHLDRAPLGAAEALGLDEMLAAYTVNAARLIGQDSEIGSLAAGKAADFIVLDRTFGAGTSADEVRATKPAQVFVAGRDLTPAKS